MNYESNLSGASAAHDTDTTPQLLPQTGLARAIVSLGTLAGIIAMLAWMTPGSPSPSRDPSSWR